MLSRRLWLGARRALVKAGRWQAWPALARAPGVFDTARSRHRCAALNDVLRDNILKFWLDKSIELQLGYARQAGRQP